MELMKNGIGKPAIIRIANALKQLMPAFQPQEFIEQALNNLGTLELKERINHLIKILHIHLPDNFIEATAILTSIKPVWDHGDPDDALRSFAAWPITDYVAEYGLEHPEEALNVLKYLTSLFSSEFAIRPFIVKHNKYCYQQFLLWVNDEDEHVRRLVSEGTRPRLPWGMRLKQFIEDPSQNIPLLNQLSNDDSLYVRRSVANHLNDIAKDNPDIVIKICKQWQARYKASEQENKNVEWVIKHATRTLVKAGNIDVFPLLGYTENPKIAVIDFSLSSTEITLGEAISLLITLKSLANTSQNLVVDFAIYFVKANGKQQAKVFKLKNISLGGNSTITLNKSQSFKLITTRKYYPGKHKAVVLVNGKEICQHDFNVLK